MSFDRRQFLRRGGAAAAALGLARPAFGAPRVASSRTVGDAEEATLPPGVPLVDYRPVVTPNGATLPFRVVDGAKVFRLVAEPVDHEFAPGLSSHLYGYNGRVHGPTIEAVEGDRVRIYVKNRLPVSTTVHWHGMPVPSGMDGVGGLSQRTIEPGETFLYAFTLLRPGTFMYHSHHDEMTQMALGLMGMFIVHPRRPAAPPPDRDYAYLLSEWALKVGARRVDPNVMTDFNVLTMNARAYPGTDPIVARTGERVRIRLGNLSGMDHHPMHLHGYEFEVTETDGGIVPPSARLPETTTLVPVGTTRTIEFVAGAPGDWAFHCHMTHHVMTQMGHDVPNAVGVGQTAFDEAVARTVPGFREAVQHELADGDPRLALADIPPNSTPMAGGPGAYGYVTMGGMFTILKVRDALAGDGDPGWYDPPPGTLAAPASPEAMKRDGVEG